MPIYVCFKHVLATTFFISEVNRSRQSCAGGGITYQSEHSWCVLTRDRGFPREYDYVRRCFEHSPAEAPGKGVKTKLVCTIYSTKMGRGEEILCFQTRIFESQFHVVFMFVHEKAF